MSEIKKLKAEDFQEKVLEADKLVVVDFWAKWCNPCLRMEPIIEELSKEFKDKVEIYKLNVDENASKAAEYGIRGIPAYFFFKNGEVVDRVIGITSKKELVRRLVKLIS
ncbi:MAG: thioredoxin [bacterium]